MRLPDGRVAVLVTHPPAGVLVLPAAVVAEEVADPDVAVVVCCPQGTDPAPVLQAAVACTPAVPVLATPRPVVDAVKRVAGRVVTGTVDRAGLRWAGSPAVVAADHLRAVLAGGRRTVRPLRDGLTRVAWLPTEGGGGGRGAG